MPKRVYKYATGDSPPEGAVYLNTVTQTQVEIRERNVDSYGVERAPLIKWRPCWLVWHHFLVEVSDA